MKNIPIIYHSLPRINFIEKFLGFFSLSLFLSLFWIAIYYYITKIVGVNTPAFGSLSENIFLPYLTLGIITLSYAVFFYTYLLMLEMISLGVGNLMQKIFSDFGEYITENSKKISIVIFIITVLGFIATLFFISVIAAIITIISLILSVLFINFKKIINYIDNLMNKKNKSK